MVIDFDNRWNGKDRNVRCFGFLVNVFFLAIVTVVGVDGCLAFGRAMLFILIKDEMCILNRGMCNGMVAT